MRKLSKHYVFLFAIGLVTLTAFVLSWRGLFDFKKTSESGRTSSKMINNVPYRGMYYQIAPTDYRMGVSTTFVVAVNEVLGFWNKDHFESNDPFGMASALSNSSRPIEYLKGLGYATFEEDVTSKDSDEIFEKVKDIINSSSAPVIVGQRLSLNSDVRGYRVVLGYSDEDQKVTVHDYYFGPTYEISYSDFKSMFEKGPSSILSFWPSDSFKLNSRNANLKYPKRSGELEKASLLINDYIGEVAGNSEVTAENIKDYEKFLQDERFQNLPAVFRTYFYSSLAYRYGVLNNWDESISIISNKVLPINSNLNEPYKEFLTDWDNSSGSYNYSYKEKNLLWPYEILMSDYIQKGDLNKAQDVLDERLALVSNEAGLYAHPILEEMKIMLELVKKDYL